MAQLSLSPSSRIALSDGRDMPRLHLGVYQLTGAACQRAVTAACEAGYRGFDSASIYGNEMQVGKAINEHIQQSQGRLVRADFFYTTKLSTNSGYESTRKAIRASLNKCGLGYIDLYLIHTPFGGRERRLASWQAVEDEIEAGTIRSGGVSNYGIPHLQELFDSQPRLRPVVNQIETHPFNTRTRLVQFCQAQGIAIQAYSPLARSMRMSDPTVVALSQKHGRTAAQVLVRWSLQHGYVPLPKSSHRARILENAQMTGWELDDSDMARLDALDECLLTESWDPTEAD